MLAVFCQLLFCHLFTRLDGASTCNPVETSPVESTRPQLGFLYPRTGYHLLKDLYTCPGYAVTDVADTVCMIYAYYISNIIYSVRNLSRYNEVYR